MTVEYKACRHCHQSHPSELDCRPLLGEKSWHEIYNFPTNNPIQQGQLAQGFEDDTPVRLAFRAPIDLQKGDECQVNIKTGKLYKVTRNGKAIFKHEN